MQINVAVTDANNIVCTIVPPQVQTITIDRGVAGNGIVSIVPVTISTFQYLRITYTNGTVSDVGPLTSTAYTATAPINITGNTISLLTVPIATGGTGATTAAAAIQNLLPSYTANGNKRLGLNAGATALEWVADGGGTVTSVAFSGGSTGLTSSGGPITSSGTITLAGTLAIANGGSGQTTAQAAMDSFAGAVTSGFYLRGNGTNVLMSGIQVADVPTLNQNTTGTASNVTGIVAIANGGTGQTTANTALNALLPAQTGNATKYLQTDGTNATWDAISLSTADITGVLPTANGGTGLSAFTANQVFYASSTSAIAQSANLTFNGTTLTVADLTDSSLTAGRVTYAGTSGNLVDNANLTFNGTALTLGGNPTITSGTANGVAYLNGSKVLTTGSALTFDGAKLNNINGASLGVIQSTDTVSTGSFVRMLGDAFAGNLINWKNDTVLRFATSADNFSTYTERMRISGIGEVGIGTINPGTKLHVYGNGTTSNNYTNGDATGATLFLQDSNGGSGNGGQLLFGSSQGIYAGIKGFVTNGTGPAGDLLFQTRGASGNVNERMRIDSAGNVGIGTNLPVGKLNVIGGLGVGVALTGDQAVTPSSGSVVFSGTNIANIQTYTSPGSSTTLGQIYNYASIADGFARFLDVVAYSSTTGGGSNIRFVTGNGFTNAERVRIDSAGNVGIGTNSVVSPARLDITKATTNNSINTQRQLRIGGDTSAAYSLFIGYGQPVTGQELGGNIQALDNGVGSKLLLNPSGGNVGIGTSSPTTKLHVAGGSLLLGAFGGEGGELSLQNAAGNAVGASLDVDASNNFRIFNVSSSATIFYTGGANERMLITSSGNVGIATNAPTARLDINNQDAADTFPLVVSNNIAGINTASAGIGFNAHTVRFAQVVGGQHEYGSYATGNLRFFTRNAEVVAEKMRIEPSGNVLIGSATPDAGNTLRYLDLYNSNTGASAGSIMRFITSNTAASGLTTVDLVKYKNGTFSINNNETNAAACTTFNVGASERMRITSSGQLLLGITSQIFSGEVLAVNAAGCTAVYRNASTTAGKFWKFPYIDNSNNIFILNQNNAGLYIADGATSWTANSDERVKDIIEPITDAANKVCSLRAVIGKYKTDAVGVRRSFLIAQDVQAVLPEAVNTQSDEMGTLGVQYTDVIPLLVAAIKEQQAIITALTARVAALESN